MRFKRLVWCLALLLAASTCFAQHYKITDLGVVGSDGYAHAINNAGNIVGEFGLTLADGTMATHAFLRTHSKRLQDLGALPGGGRYSGAYGVNDLLQVVGASDFFQSPGGATHAFLWTAKEGMEDLGTLGCPNITGANGINLFGQVVGTSTIEPCGGGGVYRAFLWTRNAGMQDLGTLPGGAESVGNAINVLGHVVGTSFCYSSCSGAGRLAFLWSAAGMQDLGVAPGGFSSYARGLNDFDWIVGESEVPPNGLPHAFLWTQNNGMRDLGTLPGGMWSSAAAVSISGQVVGSSDSAASVTHGFKWSRRGPAVSGASHAFIWSEDNGMQDLNDLIIPARSAWVLTEARAINSFGQIAGRGTLNGQAHAFLLTRKGHK